MEVGQDPNLGSNAKENKSSHYLYVFCRWNFRQLLISLKKEFVHLPYVHYHHRQNSPFWVMPFLRRFCQICKLPAFHYFTFRNEVSLSASLSALRPTPTLEDHVSVFMSPSDRVAQFYPQAPSYLFISYDSRGYGGGILTGLRSGVCLTLQRRLRHWACFCDEKCPDRPDSRIYNTNTRTQTSRNQPASMMARRDRHSPSA
jgi:hypothetical protein